MKSVSCSRRSFLAVTGASAVALAGLGLAGCSSSGSTGSDAGSDVDDPDISIAASPTPHAEILNDVVVGLLADKGYNLTVTEFNDYVLPNTATEEGEVDANYFQHQPYLDDFNDANGTHLVSVAAVHFEPFGIYPGRTTALEDLADGAIVAVPNDATNEARALLLLEQEGLLTLSEDAGIGATVNDIVENPKNLTFKELEAANIPNVIADVDIAIINGNYALGAGFSVKDDALATEDADSLAADTYANVVVVEEGNEDLPKIQALVEAILSDEVRDYINDTYDGAVVPVF